MAGAFFVVSSHKTMKLNEKFPNNYQHFQIFSLYLQCQIIVVINTAECPDRCSIRNWAIFMSIGQPYRGNPRIGTLYEICRCCLCDKCIRLSFPTLFCSSDRTVVSLATSGNGSRSCIQ